MFNPFLKLNVYWLVVAKEQSIMVANDRIAPKRVKNWATNIAHIPFRYPQPHMQASLLVGLSLQEKQVEGPQQLPMMMMMIC